MALLKHYSTMRALSVLAAAAENTTPLAELSGFQGNPTVTRLPMLCRLCWCSRPSCSSRFRC
ncbi:hypothetical protein PPL19_07296 [Pseudomonas psychrotolerans L19]|nr:hypothetical protein PPL19_07296 [Pseudomonas psychrotolerans L19]TCQ87878.1 hypothetical protein EC839_106155 [Pseudomonas sp. JUb52]